MIVIGICLMLVKIGVCYGVLVKVVEVLFGLFVFVFIVVEVYGLDDVMVWVVVCGLE